MSLEKSFLPFAALGVTVVGLTLAHVALRGPDLNCDGIPDKVVRLEGNLVRIDYGLGNDNYSLGKPFYVQEGNRIVRDSFVCP